MKSIHKLTPRLLVQLSELDLEQREERLFGRIAELIQSHRAGAHDAPLDRAQAAAWLGVSLSKLDLLVRNDGLRFYYVGDVKRFLKEDLREFLVRRASPQPAAA